MDWSDIIARPSQPKGDTGGGIDVGVNVRLLQRNRYLGDLYQIDSEQYAIPNWPTEEDSGTTLICGIFFWAHSSGALIRAAHRDVSQDTDEIVRPPDVLLLEGWRWTYGDILQACVSERFGPFKEFRAMAGDALIWRKIDVGMFTYYFRANSGADDRAFCVGVDIRGIRWVIC